jgi:hypothetical protein
MDNAVFETLLRVADSDGTIRTAAENRLKELAIQPGKNVYKFGPRAYPFLLNLCNIEFPVSLAKLTVSQQHTIPQRQISFLYLSIYLYITNISSIYI